jgi:hypothetical protein
VTRSQSISAADRDYKAMLACMLDRVALSINAKTHIIPRVVAIRLHQGYMAFRELAL